MSTLATADLSSDDSDVDFIPSLPTSKLKRKTKPKTKSTKEAKRARTEGQDEESSASSSSGGSSDSEDEDENGDKGIEEEEQEGKRIEEVRKQKAKDEFEKMRAEATTTTFNTAASSDSAIVGVGGDAVEQKSSERIEQVEMVEIQRARRFAGETIYESVRLEADDPEVIAYLKQRQTVPPNNINEDQIQIPIASSEAPVTPAAASASTTPTISTSASTSTIPKKGPIRRKPRQSLESMSAALDKGKKMTTLEKSQMDWKKHTSTTVGMEDELTAHRRTGGYLEKKDFLERVEERRNGAGTSGTNMGRR